MRGWKLSILVERGESLEEPEDLGLGKDVREDAEVDAELREALKVHLQLGVRIVGEEGQHGLVHDTEEVNYVLILEDLEKLRYLALRVCILATFGLLDLLI